MQLLTDVVLYVASQEIEDQVRDLAALTGAIIVSELVPCLTTHVVCLKETYELRSALNSIHGRANDGVITAKDALYTAFITLVTPEWLKQCLCLQSEVAARDYKP